VDGLRVIRSGLAPNDRVIVSNFQAAIAGTKVEPKAGRIAPKKAAEAASAPTAPMAAQATLN